MSCANVFGAFCVVSDRVAIEIQKNIRLLKFRIVNRPIDIEFVLVRLHNFRFVPVAHRVMFLAQYVYG